MALADIIQWASMLVGIGAAILVAGNFGAKLTRWGFGIFAGASVGWIVFAWMKGEAPLALQNVVLLGVNVFGVWRYRDTPEGRRERAKAARVQSG